MLDQTLEAQLSANETSTPVEEAKQETEQGEIKAASTEADKAAEGEPAKEEPKELSEADKIRAAMQKRIDRQTAASKAQQERIRQLEQERIELEAKAPKADDTPKQEDFDDYDEWQKAIIEHQAKLKANEIIKADKDKQLKAAQEQQAAEMRRVFDEKEKAFRSTTPDYDRVAGEAVEAIVALANTGVDVAPLRNIVMQFDNPPEMIYQLGKDSTLVETLATMPPLKMMRELVKLELALEGTAKEPAKVPEPIKSVGGSGKSKDIAQQSPKDVLAWAKKK
jgi:hypothetical protein